MVWEYVAHCKLQTMSVKGCECHNYMRLLSLSAAGCFIVGLEDLGVCRLGGVVITGERGRIVRKEKETVVLYGEWLVCGFPGSEMKVMDLGIHSSSQGLFCNTVQGYLG